VLRKISQNGTTILAHRNAAAPAVAIQVWVGVGSADEQAGEFGLAHFHEHMLFKGTERRGVGQIAAEIEAAGGEINAFTSFDQTVYHVLMSSRHFERGLDVLADAIQSSIFDEDELTREKQVVLEEIQRADDSPGHLVGRLLFATLYENHPYRRPILGTAATVSDFSREGVVNFYRRHYNASNVTLVAVGDLDETVAVERMEAAFQGFLTGQQPAVRVVEPVQTDFRFARTTSRFQQTQVQMGFHIPPLVHPDVPALDYVALILGQGESSRLIQAVKRRAGLVNSVSASAFTPKDPGIFLVAANIPAGDARPACRAVLQEIARLQSEECTEEELSKAMTIIESHQIYERESVQGQARKYGFYETLTGGLEAEQQYLEAVRSMTSGRVRDAARRYLRAENMTVAALVSQEHEDHLSESAFRELLAGVFPPDVHAGQTLEVPVLTDVDLGIHTETLTPVMEPGSALSSATSTGPAPASGGTRQQPEVYTLDCGATLVALKDTSFPLMGIRVVTRGGVAAEPAGQEGSGRLMAMVMNRGTKNRTAAEMARAIEGLAAQIHATSGRSSATIRFGGLSRHFDASWELFEDLLLRPAFSAEELERERDLQLELIRSEVDRPSSHLIRSLLAARYGNHTFGRRVLGTETAVQSVGCDDLVAMHHQVFHSSRLVIGAVVNSDLDALAARFNQALRPDGEPPPLIDLPSPPVSAERQEIHLTGTGKQAHIGIGFDGVAYSSPDRPALDVLLSILSGQGGRLFLELRDRQGLAYSVSASSSEGIKSGYVYVYMGTSPEKVQTAVHGLESVLGRITQERVSDAELERARQYVAGHYDVGLQRRGSRASLLAYNASFSAPSLNYWDYTGQLMEVTAERVREVAQQIFDLKRATHCILEPGS
jgi:zinc protease